MVEQRLGDEPVVARLVPEVRPVGGGQLDDDLLGLAAIAFGLELDAQFGLLYAPPGTVR